MRMKVHARRQRRRGGGSAVNVPILSHSGDSPDNDHSSAYSYTGPPVEMKTVVDVTSGHTTSTDVPTSIRSRSQRNVIDMPNTSIPTEPLVPSPVRTTTPPRSPFVLSEQFVSPREHHSVLEDDHLSSSGVPSSPSSVSFDGASSFASANASLRSSNADLETLQSRAFSDSLNMPASVVPGSPTALSESFSFASVSARSPRSDFETLSSEEHHWVSVGQPRTSP